MIIHTIIKQHYKKLLIATFVIVLPLLLFKEIKIEDTRNDNNEKIVHLKSWKNNSIKSSVEYYIQNITDENNPNYIKPEDRIAVFDNDGTLMVEKPLDIQLSFLKDIIPYDLKEKHPYNALIKDDLKTVFAGNNYNKIIGVLYNLNPNQVIEKFNKWDNTFKHSKYNKKYTELGYKPMLELIEYLKSNDFKIYIITGGDIDIIRSYASKLYGIDNDKIFGSYINYEFKNDDVLRGNQVKFLNLKENKPVVITRYIGKKPVVAFGNSDNDIEMLNFVSNNDKMKLVGIINHTDNDREFSYSDNEKLLKIANDKGWLIVDMKIDWLNLIM